MATVITNEYLEKHHVDKYNFKVLSVKNKESSSSEHQSTSFTQENNPQRRKSDVDASALSTSSKDALIESLMKKTDEMSSNFIKLQMKLEQKEEEFEQELKKAKEEAFAEGLKAGHAQAMEEIDKNLNQKLELCVSSIERLQESASEFEKGLEDVKGELVSAALDVAQEVIKVEVSERSAEIAKVLSEELIKDLQGASKVTIKVNPKDHTYINEHLGQLNNVTVLADRAVSEGGVIVMSDVGNIDAEIQKRFESVKKVALSE
ncbi:MAG: flagellar assembly protein FliH [Sulfurimonas sp.]